MTFNQGTYRLRIINNTVESNFVFFLDRPKYQNLIFSNKAILWNSLLYPFTFQLSPY